MASQMVVPASTDTLFFRNFMRNQTREEISEFFEREANSPVYVEFFKQSDIDGRLYIALRFESKDTAKDILNRFDGQVVLSDRIQVSWFKDLRKARQKQYHGGGRYAGQGRNNWGGGGGGGGGGDYYRSRDNNWDDDYRGSGNYDRDYSYRNSRGRPRRHSSSERYNRSKYERSSSRSASRSRSPTPERRGRDSRSSTPPIKEKRRRSKSQKNEGTLKSTVREVSPAKSDRSLTPEKDRSRERDEGGEKEWAKRDYDYDYKQPSSSPDKSPPRTQSPDDKYSVSRNTSPPLAAATAAKNYRDPRSDKFRQYYSPAEKGEVGGAPSAVVEEKRNVLNIPKQTATAAPAAPSDDDYAGRGSFQDTFRPHSQRSYSPTGSNSRRDLSPPPKEAASYRKHDPQEYNNRDSPMDTGRRLRSPDPPRQLPPQPKRSYDPELDSRPVRDPYIQREAMDTDAADQADLKRRKKAAAALEDANWTAGSGRLGPAAGGVPQQDTVGLNGGLSRELDRAAGDYGLSSHKMSLLREKKEDIERAYRNDCETFATVVKMLISKDPLLEDKLQLSLRENLKDIGQRCIYELREYIDRVRLDDQ